jgi:hypothetical protein
MVGKTVERTVMSKTWRDVRVITVCLDDGRLDICLKNKNLKNLNIELVLQCVYFQLHLFRM